VVKEGEKKHITEEGGGKTEFSRKKRDRHNLNTGACCKIETRGDILGWEGGGWGKEGGLEEGNWQTVLQENLRKNL